MNASVPSARSAPGSAFAAVVAALAISAALELTVLRMFTRTAIHIPALHQLAKPYEVLTRLGQYDYYVAAVLLILALPIAAVTLGARAGRAGVLASAGVGLFTAVALLARFEALDEGFQAALTAVAVVVMAAALLVANPRMGVAFALFAAAFALASSNSVLQSLAQHGYGAMDGRTPLWLSEVFVVGFGIATPFALSIRATRRDMTVGVAAGLFALAMLLGAAPTTKILMLWNFGLTGVLPAVAYAAALGAVALTLAALFSDGRRLAACGLVLIVAGGIGMHSTYQSGLVVLGLAAFVAAVAADRDQAAIVPPAEAEGLSA